MDKCGFCGEETNGLDWGKRRDGVLMGFCPFCIPLLEQYEEVVMSSSWEDPPAFIREARREFRMDRMMGRKQG